MMCACRVISRAKALTLQGYRHACHIMLHTSFPDHVKLFGYYPIKNSVLMQLRFDGTIGFPGGFVDSDESLETAVNREVTEELGKTTEPLLITQENYVVTHLYEEFVAELDMTKRLCLHFFAKKITPKQFLELETRKEDMSNIDFEVLGTIRCPLYTLRDKQGGLPSFLKNNFVGCARQQLLIGIAREELLSIEETQEVAKCCGIEVDLFFPKI
ncbi:U8 snoRNA-decapping enzyme-like [Actinia tenebrosa]|uniref:U8 snoRNA-decapping enzyme n=1 Tax=Actinia tenebrosa TaxID=6105 RepID=A0A6P8I7S2_ACTTE|nr:U8 snoRNA-decapping enzyme-like [Actinia tenebrosa]